MKTSGFTDLVDCRLPLQLAGMGGGMSDAALAGAVSDAGGFGMLGLGGFPAPMVPGILEAMRGATGGSFGANFLMPFLDRDAVAAAASGCRVCEFFYADPDAELVRLVHGRGALAGWQVGSLDEALAAVSAACDFVVVQGTEAGGHVRGTKALADVLAEVVGAVDVPVVASGGIGSARDVTKALESGASAVRVGTRFLAATESTAHPQYVDALLAASADDTVLTEAFSVGWPNAPHRVLRSCIDAAEAAADDVVGTVDLGAGEMPVGRFTTMPPSMSVKGNVHAMALYAGTSVDGVRDRRPAAEVVAELCAEL